VQKPMPFPDKIHKSREDEHFNRFCEWIKLMYLQIPLTDAINMPPYLKYMKDIVSNKRKIPNEEISTMLANYSFNGKVPKKLGDPGLPLFHALSKVIMLELLYVTWEQELVLCLFLSIGDLI
jgi:hypothetical protein